MLTALDLSGIRTLFATFSHTLDFGDDEGFSTCFAKDGVLSWNIPDEGLAGEYRGADELRRFVAASSDHSGGRTRRTSVNLLIESHGRDARASSYVLVTRDLGNEVAPKQVSLSTLVTTGMSFDSLTKVRGDWVFTRRDFRLDGVPEVMGRIGSPVSVRIDGD